MFSHDEKFGRTIFYDEIERKRRKKKTRGKCAETYLNVGRCMCAPSKRINIECAVVHVKAIIYTQSRRIFCCCCHHILTCSTADDFRTHFD